LHLIFWEKEFKKMGEGAVHWRAGANKLAQPAKSARPPRARIHSLLPRSDSATPRAPNRVRTAAPRHWHAHSPTPRPPPPPVDRASALAILALSLAFSRLCPACTAPPPAIGAPRASSALFQAPRRLSLHVYIYMSSICCY